MRNSILPLVLAAFAGILLGTRSKSAHASTGPQLRLLGPVYVFGDSQASRWGYGGGFRSFAESQGLRAVNNSHAGKTTRAIASKAIDEGNVSNPSQYDTVIIISGNNDAGESTNVDYSVDLVRLVEWFYARGVRQVVYMTPPPGTRAASADDLRRVFGRTDVDHFLGGYNTQLSVVANRLSNAARSAGAVVIRSDDVLRPWPQAQDGLHASLQTGRAVAEAVFGP